MNFLTRFEIVSLTQQQAKKMTELIPLTKYCPYIFFVVFHGPATFLSTTFPFAKESDFDLTFDEMSESIFSDM